MTVRLRLLLIVPGLLFLVALAAFEFGLRKGRDQGLGPAPGGTAESARAADGDLIELLLAQDLGERRFAFPEVIEASTGHRVLPAGNGEGAQVVREAIATAADDCLQLFSGPDSPLRDLRRINEASRFFEDSLRALLDAHPELTCSVPVNADGGGQRSGYPDLRVEHSATGTVAYLDPKLFETSSRESSLRTFYYEPKAGASKVREDAIHFLLGFAHDGNDGAWTFTGWELVDLSGLEVRLKAEFQASNRELYPARGDGR